MNKVFKFFLIAIMFSTASSKLYADVTYANGEKLFKQYCTSCHKMEGVLVGPALKDVTKRHDDAWLHKWIHNNGELRRSGDQAALAIWNQFGKNEMPVFTSLADEDISSLIKYFADYKPPVVQNPSANDATGNGYDYNPILYVILVIFLILVFLLTRINSNLRRLVEAKVGEPVTAPFSILHFVKQKSSIAALILILIVIGGYTTVDKAQKLGRSKGYQPDQPIAFSHKLHAGINQIDCKYCHSSVEKSKTAGIPSVNVCWNCHKGVQAGQSDAGTAEIAKLTSYHDKGEPIQWVKIHNLPDHVYFNHSQHVKVGKIECQKCHGQIQEMEQVQQFASLSMGWCINCHRETKVQFTSNNYYSQFEKLHEDLKSGKIDAVTEGMMGGTECQKCHY